MSTAHVQFRRHVVVQRQLQVHVAVATIRIEVRFKVVETCPDVEIAAHSKRRLHDALFVGV